MPNSIPAKTGMSTEAKQDAAIVKLQDIIDALGGTITVSAASNARLDVVNAPDSQAAFTYYDAGTSDERPHTITYSSVSVGASAVKTFSWTLVSGKYKLTGIGWS